MSAGSAAVDLLLDDVLAALEGRAGALEQDQLVVIGYSDFDADEWQQARVEAEGRAIAKAAAQQRRWCTGTLVRVKKQRWTQGDEVLGDQTGGMDMLLGYEDELAALARGEEEPAARLAGGSKYRQAIEDTGIVEAQSHGQQ